MRSALAYLFWLSSLSIAFVAGGGVLAYRLEYSPSRRYPRQWLASWSIKGLLLPLIFWILMNLGMSWDLQPFMPQVQAAQNSGGSWGPAYLRVVSDGLFIICSYWTAITLGWVLFRVASGLESTQAATFRGLGWSCFLGMAIPAIITILAGGLPFLGLAAALIFVPLAGYAAEVIRPTRTPPMYARAVARMKFGKYSEAEWEIIQELERCEDDFEGWMMLADLYANHFNDLDEAEQTVLEICDQPRTTPSQLSIALHRLADWHLKLACDPVAARRALQMISDRLPATHLARMAKLRSQRLPLTASELQEQRSNNSIPLPALGDSLDTETAEATTSVSRLNAARDANLCVEKLKRDPNNVGAREKLARLMAERLDQADRGIEQISLLLEMPNQPQEKRAEWLSLAAAWNIKHRQDWESGRKILEQLMRDFPDTPQAFAARRRLHGIRVQK